MAHPMDIELVLEQARAALTRPDPPALFSADELFFLASSVRDLLAGGEIGSKKKVRTSLTGRLREVMDGDFCWRVVLRLLREHREVKDEGLAAICQGFMVEPERVAMFALTVEWKPAWRSTEERRRFEALLEAKEPWSAKGLGVYLAWLRDQGEVAAAELVSKARSFLDPALENAATG